MVLPLTLSGLALVATFPIPEDDHLQWIKVALSAVGKFATSVAYAVIYIQVLKTLQLCPVHILSNKTQKLPYQRQAYCQISDI